LVLKTDVYGSVDAVRQSVEQLSTDETLVRVIHAAPGTVTESDVLLAKASKALIISFNTRIEPGAKRLAQQDRVEVRNYSIIYRLIEDVELAVKGLAAPVLRDVVEGTLEIRAIFGLSRGHNSAGCYVSDGQVSRGSMARVMRGDKELFDGPISSLRRFKDDVRQVAQGYECGIILDGFDDFQEGDKIEAHRQAAS
jgi:translation initiation factor IF-2